jgi:hypothetical protein
MKALLLALASLFLMVPAAHAWAIILGQPSLQYPARATQETIKAAEAEMKKLEFEGGIIHVSAPTPFRNLRFQAPGQSVNALVPQLEKLGFTVTVTLSDTLPAKWGVVMTQQEDGSNKVAILINAKHPKFDRGKLTAKVTIPAKS